MRFSQITDNTKETLKQTYDRLNPAELKRTLNKQLAKLYKLYKSKRHSQNPIPYKKLKPLTKTISVRYYLTQPEAVGLAS